MRLDWALGIFKSSLVIRLHTSIAGGMGLIPDEGTKIPQCGQKEKKRDREELYETTL